MNVFFHAISTRRADPPAADNFGEEINTTNPLGMQGHVAVEFGRLLYRLWSRHTAAPSAVAPNSLLVRCPRRRPGGYCRDPAAHQMRILGGA